MYSVCDPFFGKGNTGNRTLLNRSAAHNEAKSSSKIIKIPQLNVGFFEMRCPNVSDRKNTGWCSVTVNTEAKVAKGTRSLLPRVWKGIVAMQTANRQRSVVPEFLLNLKLLIFQTP